METGDAAEWLLHAESDLTYAKLGQVQPAILRNQVAFHAEQAAEKAFKAVLVHAAVEFPRTRDLQSLLLLVRNSGISVRPEIEHASALTRFAVEARYPGDIEPITGEEVTLAIDMAEGVVAWARVQICEVPGTGECAVQLE
jgi:HEPN domain-containing protein